MENKLIDYDQFTENLIKDPNRYAAIYTRESNPNATNALESQKVTCADYALERDLLIYGVYSDLQSANTSDYTSRKGFMKLIEDAKKGYFKKVLITRRDRLTRRFEEFIELRNLFKELDLEIIYSSDIQLNQGKDYVSGFVENVLVGLAELEPARINQRIKAGRAAKLERGLYDRKAPYGLRKVKREKEKDKEKSQIYEKDGLKAEVVKNIFTIYLEDMISSPTDVLKGLKKSVLEASNKRSTDKEQKAAEDYGSLIESLTTTSVKKIISNPRYAGLLTKSIDLSYKDFFVIFEGSRVPVSIDHFQTSINIEPIISSETWFKAANKWLESNVMKQGESKKRKHWEASNTSLLRCGHCKKFLKNYKKAYQCPECRFSFPTAKLFREMLIAVSNLPKFDQWIDKILDKYRENLIAALSQQKKKLTETIKNQGREVLIYLSNKGDKKVVQKLAEQQKAVDTIRQDIRRIQNRIDISTRNQFFEEVIYIAKSGYINLIEDELETYESLLLEISIAKGIKELRVGDKRVIIGLPNKKREPKSCRSLPPSFDSEAEGGRLFD